MITLGFQKHKTMENQRALLSHDSDTDNLSEALNNGKTMFFHQGWD